MRRSIALLLPLLASTLLPAAQEIPLLREAGSLKFAVIGDNGTGDRPQYEVSAQMVKARATFPFELVLMAGDNMYGRQEPQDFVTKFERPYAALLEAWVRFYATRGNHDQQTNRMYKGLAVMPGGALYTWRRWSMAIVAALGGIAGAVGVYLAIVYLRYETVLVPGWPVACAIDTAAAYYLVKLLRPHSAVLPFVLLLSIVTNVFGAVMVGLSGVTPETRAGGVALIVLALAVAGALRMQKVRSFWPYLTIAGTLSWLAFYVEGLHPAFALVPGQPASPRVKDHDERTG